MCSKHDPELLCCRRCGIAIESRSVNIQNLDRISGVAARIAAGNLTGPRDKIKLWAGR